MSLVISKVFTYDTDAGNYIQAVEAADQAASPGIGALEGATRQAINNFVVGCKQDGTWSAIKASCILAGARTLSGALVPLVGTAPTNNNFVSGDYNRKTGIQRNANNKYLNSNRLQTADPDTNHHISVWKADSINEDAYWIGSGNGSSFTLLGRTLHYSRTDSGGIASSGGATAPTGFYGISRNSSTQVTSKRPSQAVQSLTTSAALAGASINHYICTFNSSGTADTRGTSSFAFYSIGESLNLALLDARVSALITAFGVAIP